MDRFDRGSRGVLGGPHGVPARRIPITARRPIGLAGSEEDVEQPARPTLPTLMDDEAPRARASVADAADVGQPADELERAKERIRKDAAREVEQRTRGVLLDFIEVLDDLDRALAASRRAGRDPDMVEGVGLVRKRFLAKLGQHGVSRAPSLGQRFDPARHEAVSVVPVSDPVQDGMVVGVTREAYLLGDEILRPASVAVGKVH